MSTLIIEHAGKRWSTPLNGRVWIGRDATCQIVVDHPIVSRQHAWVEAGDGSVAFVSDNNSRNGTLIAGERLAEPRRLGDGDIFQVGPATIAFHTRAPELEIDAPSVDAAEVAGIIFQCHCGARLWAPRGASGSSTICPKCRQSVRCPGELPPPPTRHRVCGVCQWKIEPKEADMTCPACGVAYHAECWKENKGCAAYGCSQVNVLEEKPPEDTHPDAGVQVDPALEDLADEKQPRAIEVPLIAAAVLASLLGALGFGVPAAIVTVVAFGYALVRRGRSRMILLLAVGIGLLGTLGGLLASLYWWMDVAPMRLIGR